MKRYIRSTDVMIPGWSKRYNRDKGYHFYVLSIPNRTARVNCIDDDICNANVHGRDIDAQDMTFEGEDCIDDAMTWCEEQIYKRAVKSSKAVTSSIDGWDNRTGVIKRIDKYLYNNPDAIPPKGYVDPHGRAYESLKARYGDYVTTPFINIETEDLMTYAEENGLL